MRGYAIHSMIARCFFSLRLPERPSETSYLGNGDVLVAGPILTVIKVLRKCLVSEVMTFGGLLLVNC